MSTKIYNAYKFKGTFQDIFDYCQAYSKEWVQFQKGRLIDVVEMGYDKIKDYSDLNQKVRAQTATQFPTHFDSFDIRGSVWIGSHKNQIYVIKYLDTPYPHHNQVPKFIDERFTCYMYQNQTDGRENNPTRKKIWNKLIPTGIAARDGFMYEFASDWSTIYDVISDVWNSLETRGIWKPSTEVETGEANV